MIDLNKATYLSFKMDCYSCGSNTTPLDKNGYTQWLNNYDNDGNRLCNRCANRLIWNRLYREKWNPINDPKKLRFKGKRILLKYSTRKGLCERCGAIKGQGCKQTHRHHWFYLVIMPWACTEELCVRCHRHEHAVTFKHSALSGA